MKQVSDSQVICTIDPEKYTSVCRRPRPLHIKYIFISRREHVSSIDIHTCVQRLRTDSDFAILILNEENNRDNKEGEIKCFVMNSSLPMRSVTPNRHFLS